MILSTRTSSHSPPLHDLNSSPCIGVKLLVFTKADYGTVTEDLEYGNDGGGAPSWREMAIAASLALCLPTLGLRACAAARSRRWALQRWASDEFGAGVILGRFFLHE